MKISNHLNTLIISIAALSFFSCNKRPLPTGGNRGKIIGDTTIVTPAKDSIVYTDVSPDLAILKFRTDSFRLDLNNDGIYDFTFLGSYSADKCGDFLDGLYAIDDSFLIAPAINSNNEIITDGAGKAFAIDSASAIATDSIWASTPQILLYGAAKAVGHCTTLLPDVQGYWLNASDKYIGLKFRKSNNVYYGWLRLTCTYTVSAQVRNLLVPGNFIIKDYAYNAAPKKPILAGQKH